MPIILFDNKERKKLFPFTQTRAVAHLRFGILTQEQRWQRISNDAVYTLTEPFLQILYNKIPEEEAIFIDASVYATTGLHERIFDLETGSALADDKGLIAGKLKYQEKINIDNLLQSFETIIDFDNVKRFEYAWDLIQQNHFFINQDFDLITKDRISEKISATNNLIAPENIFVETGAAIEFATLNASSGPIYINKNATIMEGSAIRGPFVLGENSTLKLGAKIYGATSLGNFCSGGGEIKNTIMQDFSNKAHDGYLGDSFVGSWCNFGAGSSNSNIKNTAANVLMHDFFSGKKMDVGNKCGVLMGDYSRAAINSCINTGSMFGICCNIFGTGLLPRMINDFSWGLDGEIYQFEKALRDIDNWKKLKHQTISENEIEILKHIFEAIQQNKI
jgi:UDP-N-acetylglucosamine diphosphorylase/glucosamine-1-phosphate N-acetyltransferase